MIHTVVKTEDINFVEVAHSRSAYFCLQCNFFVKEDLYVGVQVEEAIRHLEMHATHGDNLGDALTSLRLELSLCRSANHHLPLTIHTMNTQEAFNYIVVHCCIVQTEQSVSAFGCRYAGPNDNSCAIGCLLPRKLGEILDRFNDPSWEAITDCAQSKDPEAPMWVIAHSEKAVNLLRHIDQSVLRRCQCVHDSSYYRDSHHRKLMWREFERIAEDCNLHMPTVVEIGNLL